MFSDWWRDGTDCLGREVVVVQHAVHCQHFWHMLPLTKLRTRGTSQPELSLWHRRGCFQTGWNWPGGTHPRQATNPLSDLSIFQANRLEMLRLECCSLRAWKYVVPLDALSGCILLRRSFKHKCFMASFEKTCSQITHIGRWTFVGEGINP